VSEPSDDRSRQAVAYSWASRIISISLEMVLPCLAGWWLDGKLGTRVVFTVLGAVLGLTLGMMHLLQIARVK
jgi:F0F1-type ATP synthase assembly protein I